MFSMIEDKNGFKMNFLNKLNLECNVPFADLQHFCVCYKLAKEKPKHLGRAAPNYGAVQVETQQPEAVKVTIADTTRVTHDLNTFLLKPKGLKVGELFDHMNKFCMQISANPVLPSAHLDTYFYMEKGKKTLLNTPQKNLSVRELMGYAGGEGATICMNQHKLDNFGYIKNHPVLANNDM